MNEDHLKPLKDVLEALRQAGYGSVKEFNLVINIKTDGDEQGDQT